MQEMKLLPRWGLVLPAWDKSGALDLEAVEMTVWLMVVEHRLGLHSGALVKSRRKCADSPLGVRPRIEV
jgi:hypothetical protein